MSIVFSCHDCRTVVKIRTMTLQYVYRRVLLKGGTLPYTAKRLLGLLGGSSGLTTNVPADVGSISSLADNALEGTPSLLRSRGSALVGKLGVNAASELVDSLLDKAALRNAGAEEDGVDSDKDPRALLEEHGRAEDAEPEEDLEQSDQSHGAVIVLFDELANSLGSSGALGLGAGLRCGWGLDGGQKVGAHVGSDVEDGVHGEGEYGKGDLA
jgi:hypothetical protein